MNKKPKKILIGIIIGGVIVGAVAGGVYFKENYRFVGFDNTKNTTTKEETKLVEMVEEQQAKQEQERAKKLEAASKITITGTSASATTSNINIITTTINNASDLTANYIELAIYVYDSNGNMIHSDWTNESNVSGNSTRINTAYVSMPENAVSYEVEITDIRIY